jgi:phage baseplate assembly protein W
MAFKTLYHGFSSNKWMSSKQFGISNFEVVKQDLYNHIFTAKGDRVMMPTFGTRIPLLTFEPNDENTRKIIEDDLRYVIEYDPRVRLVDMQVVSLTDNNVILGLVDVFYLEFGVQDMLKIEVKTSA